ncbi:MAG TPA: hypothetical protein VFB27_04245 [Opitutaceae bacterium]|nr:hypothetical protein [Opitutaceae bacterium]
MKYTGLILLLGLTAGLAAHFIYFDLHRPCAGDDLDCQLAWMRTELNLSDAQFARIKQLHQASNPQLRAFAGEVSRLQAELAAFERLRRTDGRVDFVEFAQLVKTQRAINQECVALTQRLVLAAADVMDPHQRQRYLDLVQPVVPPSPPAPPSF